MLPIRQYLSERRQEVQAQIKALRAELTDIDAAASALGAPDGLRVPKERGTSGTGKKTIKELALEALAEDLRNGGSGLEASAIVGWMASRGHLIARESLSPQLSRLKEDRRVALDGSVWRLTLAQALNVMPPEPEAAPEPEPDLEFEEEFDPDLEELIGEVGDEEEPEF